MKLEATIDILRDGWIKAGDQFEAGEGTAEELVRLGWAKPVAEAKKAPKKATKKSAK